MAELTPMMQQYRTVKERNPDCILFFRLGDFYEMFDEDARIASRELDLTLTSRDHAKDKAPEDKVPMCGVPFQVIDGRICCVDCFDRLFMLLMAIAAEKEVDLPPLQRHEQICGKSVLNDVFFICSAVSVFHVSPPYSSDLFVGQNGCARRISAPWEDCARGRLRVVISVTADIL